MWSKTWINTESSSNQKFNEYIKEVALKAGLTEKECLAKRQGILQRETIYNKV